MSKTWTTPTLTALATVDGAQSGLSYGPLEGKITNPSGDA